MTTELELEVFEDVFITVKINDKRDGYSFKTPKGWGGRHYYSFCNNVDDALQEQYPEIHEEINNKQKNKGCDLVTHN